MTDLGKEQAFKVGKWLEENENLVGAKMLSSDLPRTAQTTQEICKSINLSPIKNHHAELNPA